MQHSTTTATERPGPAARTASSREAIERTVLRRLNEVGGLVDALAATWQSPRQVLHARRWHRFRYERPVAVTPLDETTEEPVGETILAMGRDISKGGISFTHAQPLPFRKVAVSFQLDDGTCESVVTVLKWCRFTRHKVYQSGGQFERTIDPPRGAEGNWERLHRG